MKKKYQLSIVVVVFLLVFALTACDKDKPATDSSAAQSSAGSSDTSTQVSSEPQAESSSAIEITPSSAAPSKVSSAPKPASSAPKPPKTSSVPKPASSAPPKASSVPPKTDNALEIYQKANTNYKKWTDKEMVMEILGEDGAPSTVKITQKQAKKENDLHYSIDYTVSMEGTTQTISVYAIENKGIAANTEGTWEKITEQEAAELMGMLGLGSDDANSDGSILDGATVNSGSIIKQSVTTSGNKYRIHLELDPQKAEIDLGDSTAKLTGLSLDMVISKDYQIESIMMTQQASANSGGISVSVAIKTQISFRQITSKDMTPPAILTQTTV